MFRQSYILFLSFLLTINSFSQNSINDSLFVFIKGGKFLHGSISGDSDETPVRKVKLNSFYMGIHEVTNEQYCKFLNESNPDNQLLSQYIKLNGTWKDQNCKIYAKDLRYYVEEGYERYPVIFVSWYGANAFCEYYGFRLPTEAEWEYAAAGGKNKCFDTLKNMDIDSIGENELNDICWYKKNSGNSVHEVKLKQANCLGIYDLIGNVGEWCYDWYAQDYYSNLLKKNPKGPEKGDFNSHRGGSWANSMKMLRIKNRRASNPVSKKATIGFRFVKDIVN